MNETPIRLHRESGRERIVRWEKSSRLTKVPLAESRRLFVTESKSSEYMERKDGGEEGEKQGEVKGEVKQLRDSRTCAWREDGMTDSRNLRQVECDVSVTKKTNI